MLAGLSLAGSPAGAQFRIETRAVLVDVFVSDGGPLPGLRHADFELYEEGERVSFRLLDPGSLPVTVLFAMDVSASTVGERQRHLGEGAALFAGGLTDRDSCAVAAFAMEPFWIREFAPCGPAVGNDVQTTLPGGATAVRDSLIISLAALHGEEGRGVLLLFTDAFDNQSWTSDDLVMTAVRGSEALVYSIVARPPRAIRFFRPHRRGLPPDPRGLRGERRPACSQCLRTTRSRAPTRKCWRNCGRATCSPSRRTRASRDSSRSRSGSNGRAPRCVPARGT